MLYVSPFVFHSIFQRAIALAALVVLAACGGGSGGEAVAPPGSGTPPTIPPTTGTTLSQYTVSGAISVLSTAAIDSDTNDTLQSYVANDLFAQAQAIANPVLLTGHLNIKDRGFPGPNRTRGDTLDTYKVPLQAGQTIEIDFSADPTQFDIDLFLFNSSRTMVGQSIGLTRYECIRVTQTGDYFIGVDVAGVTATGSDSVYQLRISAPGGGSASCVNASSAGSSIVAGEIIAEPQAQLMSSLSKGVGVSGMSRELGLSIKAGKAEEARAMLYGMPASMSERATRMASTQSAMLSQTSQAKQSQSALGYARRNDVGIDSESALILDTIAYAKLMQKSGQFKYAEPNMRMHSLQATPTLVGTLPSNDQEYSRQKWHYDMISLPLAMQTLLGMSPQPLIRPIVAVIDTGIVTNHPDLVNNITAGYDFVSSATSAADGNGIDANPDDSSPANTNPVFHGAHVAGTVAAQGFNGLGGLGVAPMARIMPLRALGAGGSGTVYDILQAVRFAARLTNDSGMLPAERADVINLSLGGTAACPASYQQLFNQVRLQGTIVVAASGNESANGVVDVGTPANCAGVIAVGAVDARRSRSYYSNGGPTLRVVAPGGDIRVSTTGNGQPDGIFSTVAQFDENGARQSTYAYLQGTSMASPHMAGIVALMRWVNPAITPDTIDTLISNGSITEDLGTVGRDILYGYGLINAKRAIDAAIASLGNGGTPPPPAQGRIEASPSGIDFGSIRTEAVELVVQRIGATTDTVASVTASSNAISVAPKTGMVDATRLGTYLITPNRNNVTVGQTAFSSVVVTTASGRTLSVSVSVTRPGAGMAGGNSGVIYVLALNADGENPSLAVVGQGSVVQPVNGVYNYSINIVPTTGVAVPRNVYIVAGSDLDNDGKICNRGEACGAYPFLDNNPTPLNITNANTTGIDFSVSTFGGINPSSFNLNATSPQKRLTPSSLGLGILR